MAKRPVALVTGASRGLGLGTCRRLGQAGMKIVAACRDPADGARVVKELGDEGVEAETVKLDVTSAEDIAAVAKAFSWGGEGLDVLVNNAGMSMKGFDANVAETTTRSNYGGTVAVTEALLPHLREGARVVMVSSGVGELSGYAEALRARFLAPDLDQKKLDALVAEFVRDVKKGKHSERGWPTSAYGVSKAAMNAYVRLLAPRVAARGIRVNAVCPGWVRTDMGGAGATRPLEEGVASIAWAALIERDGPTGGFFRDGAAIPW